MQCGKISGDSAKWETQVQSIRYCMVVILLLSRVQLFAAPWTVAHQTPLSMIFSRQKYWSGLPFPSPRDLPHLVIKSVSPALQEDSLPTEPPGSPYNCCCSVPQLSSVQPISCVRIFATPWSAACQASLSITNSQSLPKLMSIELVKPSYHLILCCPLLLLPSSFCSIRVFSNGSILCIRWPKYWSFSFSISPSNEHPGLISFRMD